ncbi:MAG: HD domain-containing phosphohydrolase, partial [Planctomycetota bacterium]
QTRQRAQLDVEHVGKQLAESYEEMNLLYTIIQQMTDVQQPERFIRIACRELLATLPYAWIGVQFSRSDAVISTLSGRFVRAGESASSWESIRRLVRLVMRRTKAGEPWVIESSVSRENAIFESLGRAVLVQPLSRNGEVVGVMVAGDKQGRDTEASSIDMKLLGATAQHVSIFLDNAALYSDLNAMFVGTLEALTASIDAKDPYTCGHSLRVAHLTRQLAEAAEYEPDEVGTARIAGLVHDVGKIGVPEQVLSKPGKLNEEEFAWIRRHPEIGHRILKDIPKFTAILPGVLYHHERWDGKGYPEGLSGTEIPPVARMIALADAFDAMSSTRTYRKAMTRSDVLSEIERCAGSQFDPQLAALFLQLDLGEFDRLLAEHRNMQADGSEFAA